MIDFESFLHSFEVTTEAVNQGTWQGSLHHLLRIRESALSVPYYVMPFKIATSIGTHRGHLVILFILVVCLMLVAVWCLLAACVSS